MPVSYSPDSAGPSTRRTEAAAPAPEAPIVDLSEFTKAELVAEAERRGLATAGTKATLIERLTA